MKDESTHHGTMDNQNNRSVVASTSIFCILSNTGLITGRRAGGRAGRHAQAGMRRQAGR